jgi:versiconal hemiacetal acetate reductase
MGKSEEIVGKAIKKFNVPRSQLVIMTKCFFSIEPAVFADAHD